MPKGIKNTEPYECEKMAKLSEENTALRTKLKEREAGYGQLLKSANIDAHRMAEWGEDLRGVLERIVKRGKSTDPPHVQRSDIMKMAKRALKGEFDG